MGRRIATAGIIALVACTATACSAEPTQTTGDGSPVLLAAARPPEAVRDAAIGGTLEIRNGCFVLAGDEGDWLVQWPYGSTLGDDNASVNIPVFGTVHVGDMLSGGGGYGSNHDECDAGDVDGTAQFDVVLDQAD